MVTQQHAERNYGRCANRDEELKQSGTQLVSDGKTWSPKGDFAAGEGK